VNAFPEILEFGFHDFGLLTELFFYCTRNNLLTKPFFPVKVMNVLRDLGIKNKQIAYTVDVPAAVMVDVLANRLY
jgi:hypothetical protein